MTKSRNLLICLSALLLFECCKADSTESSNSSVEISSRNETNGYIFTSPKTINYNVSNEMQLQRFGDLSAGTITIKIQNEDPNSTNDTIMFEETFEIEEGAEFVIFNISLEFYDHSFYHGKIIINGTFDQHDIYGEDSIYFAPPNPNLGLFQTEKPVYRKGETVKLRLYMYNHDIKPAENTNADIWIEDAEGNKIQQWKDEDMQKGVKQYEYTLDDEAVPGLWKFSGAIKGKTTTLHGDTHFVVTQEEQPVFDLTIKKPSFVFADAKEIPITICAKYFYENAVKGDVDVKVAFQTYDWENQDMPVLEHKQYVDGCFDYKIKLSELKKTEYHYAFRRIQVIINFTELDTGVQINKTEFIEQSTVPLNLHFDQSGMHFSAYTQHFKPGLPYTGKLSVNHPDNTAAGNEDIRICSIITRKKILPRWVAGRKVQFCKNYTSDEDGLIEFILPPPSTDVVGITIEARSLKYSSGEKGTYGPNTLTLMTLTPWYSPSRSFIQLMSTEETPLSGSEQKFKFLFTFEEEAIYKFRYQVIHQGKVVQIGTFEKAISLDDDVSSRFIDEEKLLDGQEVVLVPGSDEFHQEDLTSSEERFTPFIGDLAINLKIDPSWFPYFHLLVYYVRDDREIVADVKKFEAVKCFKSQDEIQLADDVSQPASKTFILESTSSNDHCEIKVEQKSFSLFNGNTDIQSTGFLAISDMVIFTRPCKDPNYHYMNL